MTTRINRKIAQHFIGVYTEFTCSLIGWLIGRYLKYPNIFGFVFSPVHRQYLSTFEYEVFVLCPPRPQTARYSLRAGSFCLDERSATMAQQLVYYMLAVIFGVAFGIPIIR